MMSEPPTHDETPAAPRTMAPVDEQAAVLMSGVEYGDDGLRRQFEKELRALLVLDRPLRVYLGIDPTATSLTLGHTVPLRKLRQFQDLGHHCIFLIGDYTALIGDPSDKNKLRPMLTTEDIAANERTYFDQAARILDPAKTELRHNSEWLGALTFPEVIALMSKFTAAEMLRRDNFRKRWDEGEAVFLHEFLYALMQGYDAYALECDVQVGGTEQLFNLMAGRKVQEDAGQRPHVPITLPILVGLDGKERMSKSKGNHIGVSDSAREQYGKAMSIPDGAVMDFFLLATNVPRTELPALSERLGRAPMVVKKFLARTIATEFWGEAAAAEAEGRFERLVQRRGDMSEEDIGEPVPFPANETWAELLVRTGYASSKREAVRLIRQGAVAKIAAHSVGFREIGVTAEEPTKVGPVADPNALVEGGVLVRVGKKGFIRTALEPYPLT